jgi:spermidine synthase
MRRIWGPVLSWLWPVRAARIEGLHGPLEVRWERGRKVINSAQANQSFGSLHQVWRAAFAEVGVQRQPPGSVLLLGLGGGSVVHILRRELGIKAPITAVELDRVMVQLARQHFGLDALANVTVLEGDATIQVHALRERYDLVLVDLFDDLDLARGVDGRTFIHGLRDRCAEGGTVLFNTVGYDEASDARCQRVLHHVRQVFHTVDEIREKKVNRVFVAR